MAVVLGQSLQIDPNIQFFWKGDKTRYVGVGVIIKEKLIDDVLSFERVGNQIISIDILLGKLIMNYKSVNTPQCRMSAAEND